MHVGHTPSAIKDIFHSQQLIKNFMFNFFKFKVKNISTQVASQSIASNRDIELLLKTHGAEKAASLIREAAKNGNLFCQIFLSMGALSIPEKNRTAEVDNEIELFTTMAAKGGDPGSQFNLGLFYIKKVQALNDYYTENDIALIQKAKFWHEKAAAQGFSASLKSLENIRIMLGE